jgi:hypothetical protein
MQNMYKIIGNKWKFCCSKTVILVFFNPYKGRSSSSSMKFLKFFSFGGGGAILACIYLDMDPKTLFYGPS